MTLEQLNRLPEREARLALERCCGAGAWVSGMIAARPFSDRGQLLRAAEAATLRLGPADWREAFAHHPRIGDLDALRARFAATAAWAAGEQRGASGADEETLGALAAGNRAYEERFGYIFVTCATGKGARQMLDELRARLAHAPEAEIEVAAAEQRKITALRLARLLEEGS